MSILADGAHITHNNAPEQLNAQYVFTNVIGPGTNFAPNYDIVRAVLNAPGGSSVDILSAVSGYVVNNVARTAPYQPFPVAACFNGAGIAAVDGAGMWGINTILTDNVGQSVSNHGPRFLFNEFDFGVTSPNTECTGLQLGGSSLAQPNVANGIGLLRLDAANGTIAKWTNFLSSQDGATALWANIGAQAAHGNLVPAQSTQWNFYDASGIRQTTTLGVSAQGLAIATTGTASAANLTLGNGGQFCGYGINLIPIPTPSPPSDGWTLYVDESNGFALTALAGSGKKIVLGVP